MRVLVLVKASPDSEAGIMPSTELLEEMGRFNEDLADAGILVSGEGLHPTSRGVRVRFSGDAPSVVEGPFAETKELVAGFWIWKVDSLDEAIAWLKKAPFDEGEVEIRPIFEEEDFGDAFTPELRERESRLRDRLESHS